MKECALVEFRAKGIDRYPRLDTLLMIEKQAYKGRSEKKLTQIWKGLPKKVMWTTFVTAIRYLEYSGKIRVEPDRTVTWLWNPGKVAELRNKGLVF